MLTNTPGSLGYSFTETYDIDEVKSKIFIDLSHNWKASTPQKRPAVFIYRGDASYDNGPKPFGDNAKVDVAESSWNKLSYVKMPITLNCIAGPVGFAEQFVEYIKYPFLYFSANIIREYGFRNFKLVNIDAPELFNIDAKDGYSVKLTIMTEFYETWALQQDALKLKTVAVDVYTDKTKKPLEQQ